MTTVPLGQNYRHPDLGDVLTWDQTSSKALFAAIAASPAAEAQTGPRDRKSVV